MYRYYDNRRYTDPFKDYDYDGDGYPGEFIFGDEVYLDDDHMDELWKRISWAPDYWISNRGRIYSTVSNDFVYGTRLRSGHIDVSLHVNGERVHAFMHRLVFEAFGNESIENRLVRHLDDDPSYNYDVNLAVGTPLDNVRDCINNGHFRYFTEDDRELAMQKRRTPIIAVNLRTGKETLFPSQCEAARALNTTQASINRVLRGQCKHAVGHYFYFASDPKPIDVTRYKYSRKGCPVKAIHLSSGDEFIFPNQTVAANELGLSVSSISMVLSGKMHVARGFAFEWYEEDDFDE